MMQHRFWKNSQMKYIPLEIAGLLEWTDATSGFNLELMSCCWHNSQLIIFSLAAIFPLILAAL